MNESNGRELVPAEDALFGEVAGLIDGAQRRAAAAVNSELVMLYWSIGKRIREDVLGGERAGYSKRVVERLAERLAVRFGRATAVATCSGCSSSLSCTPTIELCRHWRHN